MITRRFALSASASSAIPITSASCGRVRVSSHERHRRPSLPHHPVTADQVEIRASIELLGGRALERDQLQPLGHEALRGPAVQAQGVLEEDEVAAVAAGEREHCAARIGASNRQNGARRHKPTSVSAVHPSATFRACLDVARGCGPGRRLAWPARCSSPWPPPGRSPTESSAGGITRRSRAAGPRACIWSGWEWWRCRSRGWRCGASAPVAGRRSRSPPSGCCRWRWRRRCSAATSTATWRRGRSCTSVTTRTTSPPRCSRACIATTCSPRCRRSGATRPRRTARCSWNSSASSSGSPASI